MSNKSLHHYVPQFYLKRFVDDSGHVWVYDKDTDRVFSSTPRNVAAEHGFYSLPELFPDPSVLEKQFSDLEREASLITEDWLGHLDLGCTVEIPDVNREIMSLYITTQMLRTAEARDMLSQSDLMDMDSEVLSSKRESERTAHIGFLWWEELVQQISDWVYECIWTFRCTESPDSLYTSDDPIKVRSKLRHGYWKQIFFEEKVYLLMPLTPRILMYCFSREWSELRRIDGYVVPVPLEHKLIKDANTHQVGHARRFVFSDQDDFSLAREFCAKYPGAVGQDRERFDR